MNIITQNCTTGHIYSSVLRQPFQNPFIWTVIDYDSMLYLIEHWHDINFESFELVKDEHWNFSIIIDKHVKVQYVHYKFDETCKIPIKKGPGDICYYKIWEFIAEKYIARVKRMLTEKSEPIFCICNIGSIYKDCIYSEEQLNNLAKYKNVIIVRGQEKTTPYEAAIASMKALATYYKNT